MALIDQDATIRALVQLHEETGVKTAQAIRVVREMPETEVLSAEQTTQTNTSNTLNALDCVSRQAAIDALDGEIEVTGKANAKAVLKYTQMVSDRIKALPSAQPERLTDDDFETIRIHLNAYKEKLCNQQRWKEAEEYQRIIDRFMAFASAQPEPRWIPVEERLPEKDGMYLVSISPSSRMEKRVDTDFYSHFENWQIFCKFVTAWMHLPKPYERSEE